MATYTIDTSAAEEKGLDYVLGKLNAVRVAQGKPALTSAEYLDQTLVREALKSFNATRKAEEAAIVGAAYDAAKNATQNQVKAILGL